MTRAKTFEAKWAARFARIQCRLGNVITPTEYTELFWRCMGDHCDPIAYRATEAHLPQWCKLWPVGQPGFIRVAFEPSPLP